MYPGPHLENSSQFSIYDDMPILKENSFSESFIFSVVLIFFLTEPTKVNFKILHSNHELITTPIEL